MRVATHLFECTHPGYPGWTWQVTVARASRAKGVTISEATLLPGPGSLIAYDEASQIVPADLVPPDTIVISGDNQQWRYQADVLESSRKFHAAGGKLVRLEFPRTEVQWYGDVAIVWSSYSLETEMDGKSTPEDGRVTEIFVHRNGRWTNPGWHTDSGK